MDRRPIWEMIIIRGVILTLLGIIILAWPTFTLIAVAKIIGVFLLASGVVGAIKGIFDLIEGWAGIGELILAFLAFVLGLMILRHPGVALTTYVLLLGIWFILRGIFEIASPAIDRKMRTASIVIGLLTIILGILLLNKPIAGGIALVWVVGLYSLIVGPLFIAIGLTIKSAIKNQS